LTEPDRNDEDRHAIQTYVGDMLALERHISQPLGRQEDMTDPGRYPAARSLITQMKSTNAAHVHALERRLDALGGDAALPLKSGWSAIVGAGAAAIDSIRKTRVSKALRDDYVAFNLAAIGYTMLHATALAVGDAETADLAKRHLTDSAQLVMDVAECMPEIVLAELRDDGVAVDAGVAQEARANAESSWRRAGEAVART